MNKKTRKGLVHKLGALIDSGAADQVIALVGHLRPEEIAGILSDVDDAAVDATFDVLLREAPELASDVLVLLGRHDVARQLRRLPDEEVADVLDTLPADDATWAVELLADDRVEPVVAAMQAAGSREMRERLDYPEGSAGRLMSEEFIALAATATAGDGIRRLQEAGEEVTIVYVYLVDPQGVLTGVVSLRRLLRVPPQRPLAELTPGHLISVRVADDQEEVARVIGQHDLMCVPVVDEAGRLVGVVTHDDVMDVMREEATEDMLQMAGTTADDVIHESVWRSARIRMPWLLFSLVGGITTMKLLDRHEHELGPLFVALALFMPVIVGMGGNLGTQAATIVVRGLATGRVRGHDALPVFWREFRIAAVIGVTYGLLLFCAALTLLHQDLVFCAVVGGSLTISMLLASAIGTLLPIVFHSVGVDPAVATGPLVTTSVDILGITTYMAMAGWLLLT